MPSGTRFADQAEKSQVLTVAWDDMVQDSLGGCSRKIYEEACLLSDFYFQVFNGGIGGWIGNRYFFRIHDVRSALINIGGTATLKIEQLLVEILPFLNFSFEPLLEPPDIRYYQQSVVKESPDWEKLSEKVNHEIWALKDDFRAEAEEYFAMHWSKDTTS